MFRVRKAGLIFVFMALLSVSARAGPGLKNTPVTAIYAALRDDNGDALPDALNNPFTLQGVLTLRPFQTNGVWITYLQDETGALRLTDRSGKRLGTSTVASHRPNFDEGDRVLVRGVLNHTEMDELQVEDVQLVRNGDGPRPRDVWAGELRNNHYPAQLVRLTGHVGQVHRGRDLEFFVRDETGQTALVLKPEFLMTDKGRFSYQLWQGGRAEVVGIAVRDTNSSAGLSLYLRKPSDVQFIPGPPPPPSRTPLYVAFGVALLLGLLAVYYWERRRVAEQRAHEVSKLLHELKRSEVEIRKQASFARLNPNPVLELFADGALTYWNEAAQRMAETLRCESVREILPPDIKDIVSRCLASPNAREKAEVKRNGRTISWSFFPIPEITSVHAYAQDITDQLTLETRLRQAQKIDSAAGSQPIWRATL